MHTENTRGRTRLAAANILKAYWDKSGEDVYEVSYRAPRRMATRARVCAIPVSRKIDTIESSDGEAIVKKVFHFDAPREKYHCDAAILWCFDNRFELGFRKFLKRIGVMNSDPIKVAGGAKCLASPDLETDRAFVLEQIRKSMRLHGTRRVILMVHFDCGAYGGLAEGFRGDARAEAAHHQGELTLAAANLLQAIPGVDVQGYFVDFEGIWDAELATSQSLEQQLVA